MSAGEGRALWGLLAEYRTPAELVHAAEAVRDAGFSKWDCHAPFPVHGLDGAMGIRPTYPMDGIAYPLPTKKH